MLTYNFLALVNQVGFFEIAFLKIFISNKNITF